MCLETPQQVVLPTHPALAAGYKDHLYRPRLSSFSECVVLCPALCFTVTLSTIATGSKVLPADH